MADSKVLLDRTEYINNTSQSPSEMQLDMDHINNELNADLKHAQPLLDRQKRLQTQLSQIESPMHASTSQMETRDSPKSSPLRRSMQSQDISPSIRNRSHGQLGSNTKRLRHMPSARQHDIDLATEIGEGLVEEVRKLQAQLHEKDDLLKDMTRSRVKQERIADELEVKLKAIQADEEKLRSVNWELELKFQQLNDDHSVLTESNVKTQSDLAKNIANKTRQSEEIEKLQETCQEQAHAMASLRTQHSVALAAQKDIQNDLRGEIANLLSRLEQAAADFDAQKMTFYARPALSSPMKMPEAVEEDLGDLETPPGSPPLSPIKGTPHRNATLESETLKGTLFHNQAKMLRQRKELEREKAQRLQMQRQIEKLEDEIASLRQSDRNKARRRQRTREPLKRSLRPNEIFNTGRRPISEISMEDEADNWEADDVSHSSPFDASSFGVADSPALLRRERPDLSDASDAETIDVRHVAESPSWDRSFDTDVSDVRSLATARGSPRSLLFSGRGPSMGRRSVSIASNIPKALELELQDIYDDQLVNEGDASVKALEEVRVETRDAGVMTDEPWPTTDHASKAPDSTTEVAKADMTFVYEDPAFFEDSELYETPDDRSFAAQLGFAHEAAAGPILDYHICTISEADQPASPQNKLTETIIVKQIPTSMLDNDTLESGVEALKVQVPVDEFLSESRENEKQVTAFTRMIGLPESDDTDCALSDRSQKAGIVRRQHTEAKHVTTEKKPDELSSRQTENSRPEDGNLLEHLPSTDTGAVFDSDSFELGNEPKVMLIGHGRALDVTNCDTEQNKMLGEMLIAGSIPQHTVSSSDQNAASPHQSFLDPREALAVTTSRSAAMSGTSSIGSTSLSPFGRNESWLGKQKSELCEPNLDVTLSQSSVSESKMQALMKAEADLRESEIMLKDLRKQNADLIAQLEAQAVKTRSTLDTVPSFGSAAGGSPADNANIITVSVETAAVTAQISKEDHAKNTMQTAAFDYGSEITSEIESALESDSIPSPERIRQLRTQRYLHGSPTIKAERVLGKASRETSLPTSSSISHSLRSKASIEALQTNIESLMAPPLAPSSARDTVRRRQNIARTMAQVLDKEDTPVHHDFMSGMPARSYSQRSLSSISSFASEIDDHFNARYRMPDVTALPENPTDPATIESITRTMIGMSMYKYTRRAGRQGLSEKRHKRYFWIHPYTRTLYWSVYNPVNAPEGAIIKSAPILTLHVEEDFNMNPPGLHQRSLCIETPRRTLKITAIQSVDHEDWVRSLNFLLFGSPAADQTRESALETDAIIRDFNPGYDSTSPSKSSPIRRSLSIQPNRFDSQRTVRPPSERQSTEMSRSLSSRFGAYFSYTRSSKSEAVKASAETFESRGHVSGSQTVTGKRETLTLNDIADGYALENVRACCGGKHDVRDLCNRPSTSRSSSRQRGQ